MGDLIKKTKIVPFINTGTAQIPVWTQIKKSTSFTLAMNPQTKTFDFISMENPQNEIDSYQPSLAQSITMFKGEPDYEAIFDMLFNRATGAEAHRDALICFYKEQGSTAGTITYLKTTDVEIDATKTYYTKSGDVYTAVDTPDVDYIGDYYERVESGGTTVFKCWKIDALVVINQLDSVNENIDFDLNLNDIENGAVTVSNGAPSFVAGTWSGTTFTPDAE
jgi:hypothetical protein